MIQPERKYSAHGSYRYGFNGQEKSTELKESLYNAEYWQYDSRIGRRWDTDPIKRSDISPYCVLSNSPIIMIDFKGNTDIWSIDTKTGQATLIQKIDDQLRDIKVQLGDKTVLLSDIVIDSKKRDCNCWGVANIIGYYAGEAGVGATPVAQEAADDFYSGSVGVKKTSRNILAETDENDNIWININNDNKISEKLSDYGNLKSTLLHEKYHRAGPSRTHGDHVDVYLKQMEDVTFENTTLEYRLETVAKAYNRLAVAIDRIGSIRSDSQETIDKLQNRLNAITSKFKLSISREAGGNFIRVTDQSNGQYSLTEYENIDNPNN